MKQRLDHGRLSLSSPLPCHAPLVIVGRRHEESLVSLRWHFLAQGRLGCSFGPAIAAARRSDGLKRNLGAWRDAWNGIVTPPPRPHPTLLRAQRDFSSDDSRSWAERLLSQLLLSPSWLKPIMLGRISHPCPFVAPHAHASSDEAWALVADGIDQPWTSIVTQGASDARACSPFSIYAHGPT